MRIIHTCLRYPPATGGVETYVKEIVKRTHNVKQKRDVRVLTSKMRTHGPITELDPELLLDDPIYIQRLHHAKFPLFSYPILQALKYYIGHHKPDILHGYSFWYQPADITARYATKHNIPFIFHPIYYENSIRRKPLWQLYKKTVGKKTFAAADVVVVISPHEQKLIEEANFPVKRFELIPPGIDTDKFEQPQTNPFNNLGIEGTILLTVSRLSEGKGIDELIQALPDIQKDAPDIQLAIVGEDFGAKQSLQKLAKEKEVDNVVHFLGKLSEKNLIGAYQNADAFIHPSHQEAFGIVVAEALAAGTPVVARNIDAIPFVAPHNKAGLLFNTQAELVEHINTLLTDDSKRGELISFGKQHVKENFSWDKNIKKLLKLYAELT